MGPILTRGNSHGSGSPFPTLERSRSLEMPQGAVEMLPHQRSLEPEVPGEQRLAFSGTPLKPVKMPDESHAPENPRAVTGVVGEVFDDVPQETVSTSEMRILVAEDDPVNSRIIKKRLEKLGHSVTLTINGEECASAFADNSRDFDVILMDMQVSFFTNTTAQDHTLRRLGSRCPLLTVSHPPS